MYYCGSSVETSVGHQVDLPVQNAKVDNGEAYRVYCTPLCEGPAPKKYTVMLTDHGSCLDVQYC
jgi:hypothetical protein